MKTDTLIAILIPVLTVLYLVFSYPKKFDNKTVAVDNKEYILKHRIGDLYILKELQPANKEL